MTRPLISASRVRAALHAASRRLRPCPCYAMWLVKVRGTEGPGKVPVVACERCGREVPGPRPGLLAILPWARRVSR